MQPAWVPCSRGIDAGNGDDAGALQIRRRSSRSASWKRGSVIAERRQAGAAVIRRFEIFGVANLQLPIWIGQRDDLPAARRVGSEDFHSHYRGVKDHPLLVTLSALMDCPRNRPGENGGVNEGNDTGS